MAEVSVSGTRVEWDSEPGVSDQLVPPALAVAEYIASRLYGLPPFPSAPVKTSLIPPPGPGTGRGYVLMLDHLLMMVPVFTSRARPPIVE